MNLQDVRQAPLGWKKKFPAGRGHGSGLGKNCGKGAGRGQKGRQGESFLPYFEGGQMPLVRKLPKRGFNNKRFALRFIGVNIGDLEASFNDGDAVTPEALLEKRLVTELRDPIKILGDGSLTRKLTVRAHAFTKKAEEQIRKAGGTVERLPLFPSRPKPAIISLRMLQEKFNSGDTVTPETLAQKGVLREKDRGKKIKITFGGHLTKKLTVHAHEFSRNAMDQIRKAGGKAVVIEEPKG